MNRPRKNGANTSAEPTHGGDPKRPANRKSTDAGDGLTLEPIRSDRDVASPDEVSYRKPPKKSRWSKGRSGNPKGRKKGSKNKRTVIIEMMEAKLGRKIPDPKKLTRYEAMMFKGIQQALGGCIRSMGFVLGEYRKAIETSGALAAAATTEEDQQAYNALCEKIRREIEGQVRADIPRQILCEAQK
jgi:hypothetical protein